MEQLTKEQILKMGKLFLIKIIQETDIMMAYQIEPQETGVSVYLMDDKVKILIDIYKDNFIIDFFFQTIQNKECLNSLNSKIEYGEFFIDEKDNSLVFEMIGDVFCDKPTKDVQNIFNIFMKLYNNFSVPDNNIFQLLKTTLGENYPFNVEKVNKNKKKEISVKTTTIEEVAEFLANKDVLMCVILQRALYINYPMALMILDYLVECNAVVIDIERHYQVIDKAKVKKTIIELSSTFI